MPYVTLTGTQALSWRLQTALAADGWRIAPGAPDFRILCDAGVGLDDVPAHRDFLLRGGRLLLLGGEGPLLARLHLTPEMNTTVDGEYQRYAVEGGNYIRENFFGPDPRLRQMVSHLQDDELRNLPRGGHALDGLR